MALFSKNIIYDINIRYLSNNIRYKMFPQNSGLWTGLKKVLQEKKKKSFRIPDEHTAGTCFTPPTSQNGTVMRGEV